MQRLQQLILSLVIIAVVIVVGFKITGTLKDQTTENSTAYNETVRVESAMSDVVDWLPIIVIVVIAALVLGYLMGGFGRAVGGGA